MDATQAMTTGHVAAATVIASEVRTRAALFLPLPLAGEVAALVRARRVGEISPRILAPVMWRHPHPNPPPQAQGYRIWNFRCSIHCLAQCRHMQDMWHDGIGSVI